MKIKEIQLIHFRNYKNIHFSPNEHMNIFLGKNAQGKTNLLESMEYLITGRSFRTSFDQEVIRFGEDHSYIRSLIESYGYDNLHELKISKLEKKRLRINGEELKSIREFKGEGATVVFSPTDLNMIKFSPTDRRKYIDDLLIKIDPWYEKNLNNYKKILEQRNKILKTSPLTNNKSLIEVYSLQLATLGTEVIRTRLKTMKHLSKEAKEIYFHMAGEREELTTRYLTTIPFVESQEKMIELAYQKIMEAYPRDLELRRTTVGPHRDDLQFLIDKKDLKNYGSQGQQRSVVLAMKLAEVKYIKEKKDFYPLLLLDDVFSELDQERKKFLVEYINGCQCFITMTDSVDLRELQQKENHLYYIQNNEIKGGL